MKKYFVLFFLGIFLLSFGAILEKVTINGLNLLKENDLEFAYASYLGKDINDYAIADIIRNLKGTGYFSSVEWSKIESEKGIELVIDVLENKKVEKVNLEINGVELVSKDTLNASITLLEGKPFSFMKFRESILNISKIYEDEGYIVSNVFSKNKDQGFIYVTGTIDATEVTFKVIEYALYSVEFSGEVEGLEEILSKIKKDANLKEYKDYLEKNWFLRLFDNEKSYYPKMADLQRIFQEFGKYVYFSPYSNIQILDVNGEKPSKKLSIVIVQNKLLKDQKDQKFIKGVEVLGNTLNDFSDVTLSGTVTNLDLLNTLQKVKSWYDEKNYIVSVKPEIRDEEFLIHVTEYKFGDVEIEGLEQTKPYTFDDLISIKPGGYANRDELRNTYVEIYKTQFFDGIDFDITPAATDVLDVKLKLEEKVKKFNFIGGGTWGPPGEGKPWYEGLAGQLQLKTVNPFGLGQSIGLSLFLGVSNKSVSFNYSIRKPFAMPVIFGGSLNYSYITEASTLTDDATVTNNFGFDITLSSLKINNNSFTFGFGMDYKMIYFNTEEEYLGGNVLAGYTFETLDDLVIPTEGWYFGLIGQKYFKILGNAPVADKFQEELSLHIPFGDFTLASRFFASQLFQYEGTKIHNYLSGLNSLRGATLEGNMTFLMNNDIRYVDKNSNYPFYIAGFGDFAFVGDEYTFDMLKWSVGVELGLNLPFLGLIRVGEAYYENNWNFFFLMGKTF
ncbi:hypothetical protein SU69_04675 [Thermosipho melanesiensis]|uniref:Surface antigen variable number repeat protein n=2 Tax=Thermosipho melanesiensis TaxID=46541 RepID=A6LLH6_THEM4|nr:POTRA domain-containing protein [Thermosipho melanesiensis]ABR30777.1 surface antigen variable number repeat protein [Thermosipho melanesiensis BI429]APT73900.1 hypothetical protein BW47_04910 [Thermosipho melanesiensis]OOC35839.1 hypothetical protein SU68_04730 [Thermosipho melanesiensis]OOC38341.1 hypothetical protein SU69_04675 [Thermosipho melanesiensis]OOC38802.1 hypothetical protein SU70_04675 [Thermosipho melanesiensis]